MKYLIISFLFFMILVQVFDSKDNRLKAHQSAFIPSPLIQYFHFGYAEVLADGLWIKYNESFVHCHADISNADKNQTSQAAKNPVDTTDVNPSSSDFAKTEQKKTAPKMSYGDTVCAKLWSYRLLDLVTDLTPKFYVAYSVGAMTLSVVIDDIDGASKLFDKGIREFPDDWSLLSRAGYHFLIEVDDKVKAATYLGRSAANGGPEWNTKLAAKLFSENGKLDLAITTLRNYWEEMVEGQSRQLIEAKLKSLIEARNNAN